MEGINVDKVTPNEVTISFGLAQLSFSFVGGTLKTTSRINLSGGSGKVYLPDNIFAAMTRQAAQILKEQMGKDYQWFVEPLDAATNEAVYNGLRAKNASTADELRRIVDADGKEHMVWQADYEFIHFVERSAESRRLRFLIFNRLGENAKARPWPFPRRRTTAKRPASQKATA